MLSQLKTGLQRFGVAVEQRLTIDHPFDYTRDEPIVIEQIGSSHDRSNEFENSRLGTNLENLFRTIRRRGASPPEILPILAALNGHSITSFATLQSLHGKAHSGSRSTPSPNCIKVMRDLVLESVDQKLQGIYREFLRSRPSQPGLNHAQKIRTLEGCRDRVREILIAYDWHWLAEWLDLRRIGETAESCVGQVANFAFSVNAVNFLFTHHCNISCAHCYNNSGPHKKKERIALDRMLAIIAQMPGAGIRRLHVTGGEPFLYPHDLLAMIRAGRAVGLEGIGFNTNAFWASTDERARQMLDRLARAGFMQGSRDFIRISGGVYHQEFIQFERVLTAARNYYDRFGKLPRIDFELPPQGGSAVADEVRNRISTAGLTDRISLEFRQTRPHGRGERLAGSDGASIHVPCGVMKGITINPDETAQPCISLNHENNGIVFGRSDRHGLRTLVKRMQNDPILQFLATKPMEQIFAFVAKEKRQSGYSGICHLCKHALGDLTEREPLQAALFTQQNFYPFWFTLSA